MCCDEVVSSLFASELELELIVARQALEEIKRITPISEPEHDVASKALAAMDA
jgi:hypothetical protein